MTMSGIRGLALAVLTALAVGVAAIPAAADPDHPRCTTITIQTRSDIPSGLSVRAVQEGLLYPVWCR
jgi:hypothetical protein